MCMLRCGFDRGGCDSYDPVMAHRDAAIPARLIGFVIGRVTIPITPTGPLEPKPSKAAPNYPDIMPRQQLIESQTIELGGRTALQAVKTYTPGYVIVEIGVDVEDLLTEPLFELHTDLIDACRRVLGRLDGDPQFQEEYRVYCISNYTGPGSSTSRRGRRRSSKSWTHWKTSPPWPPRTSRSRSTPGWISF